MYYIYLANSIRVCVGFKPRTSNTSFLDVSVLLPGQIHAAFDYSEQTVIQMAANNSDKDVSEDVQTQNTGRGEVVFNDPRFTRFASHQLLCTYING